MEPQQQQSDLGPQQDAARDYKPQLEGPLVGEKTSSHAITEEYAKADPIYVAKTMTLPQTYSHYRPIQGDGNCGWRAVQFAYFEALIRCGDINQIQSEWDRIALLNDYIEKVGGHEPWMFEDMVGETFSLFDDIIKVMGGDNAMNPTAQESAVGILMDRFNNPETSQCIVYHLRLLASSWLKGNPDQYGPFIPGGLSIDGYITNTILPVNETIDHVCLALLVEVLLKETKMVLEIAYLDRSEGHQVNVHRMPEEANGQDPSVLGPIIYLLYRPGHYDILYRHDAFQVPTAPPAPVNIQVNRATSFTQHHDFQSTIPSLQDYSTLDMSALAMIPGFDAPGLSPLTSPPSASSPMTDPYAPSPQPSWIHQHFPESMPPAPSQQPTPPQQQSSTAATVHPLRFSKYNFPNLPEMVESNPSYEPSFTTNTFKNSHFNVAHYNNMNFQPEMYNPSADDEIPSGRSGGRKRSSEHCAVIKKESRG